MGPLLNQALTLYGQLIQIMLFLGLKHFSWLIKGPWVQKYQFQKPQAKIQKLKKISFLLILLKKLNHFLGLIGLTLKYIVTCPKMGWFRETGLFRVFLGIWSNRWLYQMKA